MCDCAYPDRAAVRASPFAPCPLCGLTVSPYRAYAETMRRFDERLVDTRAWGPLAPGLAGRLARGYRHWRPRR